MKKTVLKIIIYLAGCLIVPFIITMIMTGVSEENRAEPAAKTVILNYDNATEITDVTDYVIRTVAAYYQADDGTEFLKALAVIVRTYVQYAKGDGAMTDTACIALTTLSEADMKAVWGEDYENNLQAVKLAVNETEGEIMTLNQSPILPYFHLLSSGTTRKGNIEYLECVDCSQDMDSEDYLSTVSFDKEELVKKLSSKYSDVQLEENPTDSIQIAGRDDAGYVTEIMVGNITMTGDELADILSLKSSNFIISADGSKTLFTVKGIGSGYGMSLNTGRLQAQKGYSYQEILSFFYKNIQLTSE